MPVEVDKKPCREEIIVKPSPVFELAIAFHVLSVPGHHGFLSEWIRAAANSMSKDEQRMLGLVSGCSNQGLELCSCVFDIGEYDNCGSFIEKFGRYSIIDFLYAFLEENVTRDRLSFCLAHKDKCFEVLSDIMGDWATEREIEAYQSIITGAEEACMLISSILRRILDGGFNSIIDGQAHNYISQAQSLLERLRTQDPLQVSQEIMGKRFQRVSNYEKYFFVPSYFLYPHNIRVFNDKMLVLLFSYGLEAGEQEERVEKIDYSLRVIADKTRLKILRQLISSKSYGKILAGRLNLTTATISHHIDILREEGLVEEERAKNVKYFSCNTKRLEHILQELADYLFNK
jgi:DNA-binding transcriptional ArsR family regulator